MKRKVFAALLALPLALGVVAHAALPARAADNSVDAIKKRGVLKVGVKADSAPFGSLDPKTNTYQGFDVDVAHQLAKSILGDANKVEFTTVNSSSRTPMVQNGDIDMFIATATITPDRLKQIDFSNVYYRAGQTLLVSANNNTIKSYSDLAGKTVCSATGSTPEQTIRRLVPNANVQTFAGYADCVQALKGGRVDAVTTDNVILQGYEDADPKGLKIVGNLFTFEPYGIGIAKGNTTLVSAVNAALGQMGNDGEYAKIHQKWLHKPLPADWKSWYNEPAAKAADQWANQAAEKK